MNRKISAMVISTKFELLVLLYCCFIRFCIEMSIRAGVCSGEVNVKSRACGVLDLLQYMLALKRMDILQCKSDESKKLVDGDWLIG